MRPFAYERPTTLSAAVALLTELGPDARLLAGGTDLIIRLRDGTIQPRVVVDIKRIADLESAQAAAAATSATATTQAMPPGAPPGQRGLPPGAPPLAGAGTALAAPPPVVRVTLAEPAAPAPAKPRENVGTYLPVSFFRGRLLGGMDAPTGGQAQSNPLPILLEATSNAFLPNGYRSEVKRCFVIGSGYGDISSERAYIRLISLSCVRHDGSTLEANLKGNVYGEDGKLGMRGRLVTKQGQLLANALRAGIVSGIGQGFAMSGTSVSSSALGAVATQSGVGPMRRGLSTGVGNAMETLANYYIRMAEQTFPVIEIDASREVDLVLTAGVKIGAPLTPLDEDDTAHQEERP